MTFIRIFTYQRQKFVNQQFLSLCVALFCLGEGGNKASRIHDFSPFVRKKKKQSELETKNQRNVII